MKDQRREGESTTNYESIIDSINLGVTSGVLALLIVLPQRFQLGCHRSGVLALLDVLPQRFLNLGVIAVAF